VGPGFQSAGRRAPAGALTVAAGRFGLGSMKAAGRRGSSELG
jgi:hypothetical protein